MAQNVTLESLECSICHDDFKAPTFLTCGHSYCKVCLDEYDKQHRGQDFMECPLCKRRTKLGENRVAGLAPNFSLKGVQEELNLKVDGKSSDYCSLHKQVFNDIFCLVCKKFICLTCLFNDEHEGHRYKKKEELEAVLEENRNSVIQKSEEKKAEIKKSITNTEQHMRDIDSYLDDIVEEIESSFLDMSETLQRSRGALLQEIDDIRNESGEVMINFIARQKESLQIIDVKSALMGRKGIASKLSDSDTLKTRYIEFLDLENELKRKLNEKSVARAKREVENTRFCPGSEHYYDIEVGSIDSIEHTCFESESENESESDELFNTP